MSWLPLVGHDRELARLRHAAKIGRLAHAYLFAGPPGIGKKRFARHVAQGLLCEARRHDALDPCGQCPACRQIEAAAHPDYVEVGKLDEKNEFTIEVIRELCRQLTLKSTHGGMRIAVLDDAELLNDEASNAFLKTLEEPQPGALLMLISTNEESHLPTILSRCQVMRFHELSEPVVADLLLLSGSVADAKEAKRLAALGGGSVARSLDLVDPAWSEIRETLISGLANAKATTFPLAKQLLQFADSAGKESAVRRGRLRQLTRLAAEFYRSVLWYRETGALPDGPERRSVESVGRRIDTDTAIDLIDRCLDADYHLGRFLNQSIAVECWIDDLLQLTAGMDVPTVGGLR